MQFNAISDELFQAYKKHNTRFIISFIITFIFISLIVVSIMFHKYFSFAVILIVITAFNIVFPIFLLQWKTTNWLKRSIKEIGKNLIVNISLKDNLLVLKDNIDGDSITIKHNITGIKVMPHVFTTKSFVLCDMSGLLFTVDEAKFFRAMLAEYHKKFDFYHQRIAQLESGFFIACTKENAILLTELFETYDSKQENIMNNHNKEQGNNIS